ncbi:hypothetical protein PATSB16_30490 [Pandoraea thiooxydans]|uniref:Carboxypeptidase regulatory-like domain-containing protein n=1 Tax=Pandoraea thiooxydans TaxID=445709 RepID=A0A0U4EZF6_9BURK|nr:carboxypeptidase-like regulatory domain-containing protein [Pandoraea thiooxydans]ALX34803.1 hypothetical protein ABW99_12355 [Pandoraea thiooxydans]APR96387.1 hypothetical protein PATSB16_30490 [Pandoraea thiooxydans]
MSYAKNIAATLAVSLALAGAAAAQAPLPGELSPQRAGSVAYLSGGVGEDEVQAMRAAAPQYSLRMTFAQAGGAYLADVHVRIERADGAVVLSTITTGPFLYVELPPGTYRVRARYEGAAQERNVTIARQGSASPVFVWAGGETDAASPAGTPDTRHARPCAAEPCERPHRPHRLHRPR